jgi:hypothetical protein
VLRINPIFLYVKDTLFSVTNAASNAAKRQFGVSGEFEKLNMLFSNVLNINTFNGARRLIRHNLPLKYPTDVQAEVLVKDEIHIGYINQVCFANEDDLAQTKAAMYCFDTSNFVVNQGLFTSNRI